MVRQIEYKGDWFFMKRKYSVFTDHVGTFCDRYCMGYSEKPFTISEKFDRIKSIPLLSAVDLNMTPDYANGKDEIRDSLKRTGLNVNCVMMDSTADRIFKQGFIGNSYNNGCINDRYRSIQTRFRLSNISHK